jgi:hypothetical protein
MPSRRHARRLAARAEEAGGRSQNAAGLVLGPSDSTSGREGGCASIMAEVGISVFKFSPGPCSRSRSYLVGFHFLTVLIVQLFCYLRQSHLRELFYLSDRDCSQYCFLLKEEVTQTDWTEPHQ